MRISDWSSDVCSSDLLRLVLRVAQRRLVIPVLAETTAKTGAQADGLARGLGEAVLHPAQLLGREPAAPPLELAGALVEEVVGDGIGLRRFPGGQAAELLHFLVAQLHVGEPFRAAADGVTEGAVDRKNVR